MQTSFSLKFGGGTSSGSYKYSMSGYITPTPYLATSFKLSTGNVVTSGTYYVGLSSSGSYSGTNPTTFLNYGYKQLSVSSGSAINTSFNFKYPREYTKLYCYVIKYGSSGGIFSSSNLSGTLTQYYGNSFSFNIYKPTNATSINYYWDGETSKSSTSSSVAITRNNIKYSDILFVNVVYPSIKNPDHTICIASASGFINGQISTSESSGGTTQYLTMNASDIGFFYEQSNGTVQQGASGTKLELYSIITNPFSTVTGLVYNGSVQTGIKGSHNTNLISTSGSKSGTNAGTYTFTATAKSGYYFEVSGDPLTKVTTKTMTWLISRQAWYIKDHCTLYYNQTYNGSAQTILKYNGAGTLPTSSSCGSTISLGYNPNGNTESHETAAIFAETNSISRTDAGTYYLWGKAHSLENPNYYINDGGNVYLGSSTISKVNDSITWTNLITSTSKYATDSAKTASSTDSAKTIKISDGVKSKSGRAVSVVISQVINTSNNSNISNHGWTISTDFKTITIPANFACGSYTCIINYSVPAGTNYNAYSSSIGIHVDINAVTLQNGDYNSSNSDWYAKISIGSGITADGGSATITASAGHTHYYYEHYSNGANSSQKSKAVSDGGTLSIDSQYIADSSNASSGKTIDRFSISDKTLNHKNMDRSTGWDTVNVKVTNDANKSVINTARTYVQNSVGAYYNTSTVSSYGTPSLTLTNNLTAAGGSVTVTCSVTDTYYRRRNYTSGSYDLDTNHTKEGTACWRITSNGNSRFGCSGSAHTHGSTSYYYSGSKVTHSSMTTNATTDTVGITAYNHNDTTKTSGEKTASVTNKNLGSNRVSEHDTTGSTSRTHYGYQIINFASIGDISAAGGSSYGQGTGQSRTRTESGTYPRYAYATTYTAYNDGDNNAHGSVTYSNGSTTWSGSYSDWSSWGGNTTVKGDTISASSLGTTVKSRTYIGTSSVTWNGVSASADIYQEANVKDSSSTAFNGRTQNCYQPYTDYRIINFASVGDIPAGGGKSYGQGTGQSRTCYTGSTYTKYDYYYLYTAYHDGDTSAKTHHYTSTKSGWTDGATPGCGSWGGDTTVKGNDVTASSLGKTIKVRTYIDTSTVTWNSKTASADIYQAANSVGSYYDTSVNYGTPSLTLANNLTAGGGSVTVTCSVKDTYNTRRDYDSGSYDTSTRTVDGTACWRITSNGNNRFGYSGTAHSHSSTNYYSSGEKVTHSSMTTNATTDTVGITAYNHSDLTKTSGKTASVTNSSWWEYDNVTSCSISYSNSVCRNDNGITVSPSTSATQKKRIRYSTNSTSNETNCSITKSYAMTTGNGASINTTTGVITWTENQSTSTRTTNTITCTFKGEGDKSNTATCTASQSAGYYTYATPSVSLSYSTNASCGSSSNTSPTNSPSLSYSQTYGWNGRTSGAGTVSSGASSVSYSMTAGSGASSINSTTGVVTWSENQTLSVRTNNTVSVSVTVNGKTGSKSNVSTSQSAGYYTYSELSGGSLSYVNKNAASGTVSPSVSSPTQTYGWNGRTSGIGSCTVTAGNYSMKTGNGASINTSNGVITWEANKAGAQRTSNQVSRTYTGSGSKTKTLTATATQLADAVSTHSATTSIGSGITAGGGSATVSGSCTRTWVSGYKDYPGISKVEITSQSRYTGVDLTGTASTITRYSVSSTTLSHTTMDKTTGSDYVKIKTTFTDGCTATASTYVNNTIIPHDVRLGKCYYSTISAAGGTSNPVIAYSQDRYCTSGSKYDTVTSGAKITYSVADPIKLDPLFYNGTNGVYTYNNSGGGTVTNERKSVSGAPSGVGIEIINKGSSSPGLGGWYFAYTGTAGQSYVCTFLAKIPTGRNVQFATNSVGSGGTYTWLSTQAGTGDWATYSMKVTFGTSPSSSFFFYLDGNFGTTSSPVTWYLGSAYLSKVTNVSSNTNVNTSTGAITMGTLGTTVQDATARSGYGIYATITLNGKSSYVAMYPEQAANVKDKNVTGLNERTQNCYQSYTDYRIINFASVGNIPASGGSSYAQGTGQSRTCYTGSSYTKYDYYYLYSAYHSGDTDAKTFSYTNTKSGWIDGATPGCGSWGNVETVTGSTVTVSSLGTTVKAVTKVGTSSVTWHSKTASADISQAENKLESISIVLGNSAVSKPGGDATGHPSSAHYDLAYGSSTSPTVTATYTSGSTANVTSNSTFKSSDTTVATIS